MDSAQSGPSLNRCTKRASGNTLRSSGTRSSEYPDRSTATVRPKRAPNRSNSAS
ncbi:hypothetical protein SMD44_00739 [Streptomyces alboflavus]|uniref:Uncharacterized protein n=1 Tax=Streptomyces alboflavus TaxID=67267 RepID=A0A1Z1W4J0_9ACTN|nr:hypothetical protein SMD44_00739 [Streptomyces alboflavus]